MRGRRPSFFSSPSPMKVRIVVFCMPATGTPLKHLLATGTCQVHSEDAYYGHLVLRLMGCLVLFYTSRVICKGRMTMEEIIFSLKHYWRFVDSEALELK